jgi:hypothetical protein
VSEVLGAGSMTFASSVRSSTRRESVVSWARANWELVGILALVSIVFQPWNSTLLPVTDFGTFLAERGSSNSVILHFLNLTRYYAADGRFCLVPYLDFALATRIFGLWAPGWYWMYFVLNCVIIVLGREFFLRTGAGRVATFFTIALWATMGPTAEAWIRPTGEPFALIFLLIGLRSAINFADAPDWRRRIVILAVCAVGIVYSKEVLVVLLPVAWLFSRVRIDGRVWTWAPWQRRDTILLAVVFTVTLLALTPVAYVALTAPQQNYAAQYGQSLHPWSQMLHRLEIVVVPAAPRLHRIINLIVDPGWTLLFVLPNLLWIRLIAGGVVSGGKRILWPVLFSLVWISLGLLVYTPWPISDEFYMLPFAFGAMFGSAHAINCILNGSRRRLAAVAIACGILIAGASVEGRTVVYHRQLRAKLYAEVIDNLAARPSGGRLIGATPEPAPVRRSWAKSIQGFGGATRGLRLASAEDQSCDAARKALSVRTDIVVVSTGWGCGKLVPNSEEIRATVPRYQWPWLWERHEVGATMYIASSSPPENPTSPASSTGGL